MMPAVLTNHRVAMVNGFWLCAFCKRRGTTAEVATWGETCEPRFYGEASVSVTRKPEPAKTGSVFDWPCPTCGAPPGRKCRSLSAAGLRENRQPHRTRRGWSGE